LFEHWVIQWETTLIVNNPNFAKFRFRNVVLLKRGRVVRVSTVLVQDIHLYLYYTINDGTFVLNSTSNCLLTPATSPLEHVHRFLIGEKLCGWKEKIKK